MEILKLFCLECLKYTFSLHSLLLMGINCVHRHINHCEDSILYTLNKTKCELHLEHNKSFLFLSTEKAPYMEISLHEKGDLCVHMLRGATLCVWPKCKIFQSTKGRYYLTVVSCISVKAF